MISQIEIFFSEIENLIKLQLKDEIQNQSEIKQKFKEGKKIIDELEEDNEEQHGLFRYKYHTIYASYFRTVDEISNACKQENLAKNYEKYVKNSEEIDIHNSIQFIEATSSNISQDFNQEGLEEKLKMIQSILGNGAIENIRKTFEQLNKIPQTFEGYQKIVICETDLIKMIDNVIDEVLMLRLHTSLGEPQTENDMLQLIISSLNPLKSLAIETAYLKRITFMRHVLNSSHKKEIFYSNIPLTEEGINKRFRELALHFHPDKTSQPSNWIQDKHKNLSTEMFRSIQGIKESLLADFEKGDDLISHEKKANELWKLTIDFRNAAKGQCDKLKLLRVEDVKEYSSDQLERYSIAQGTLAYHEYRAACKIADKGKQLHKQVKLRSNMALCLYITNQFLEAQLYALSAILLLFRNSQNVTQQDLIEAKKIFDKVKGGDGTEETPKLNTEIKLNCDSDNTLALVKFVNQEISFFEKKNIQGSISNDLSKIGAELILKADRSLVCYQATYEEILHSKDRAIKHKLVGGAVATAGACVSLVNILEAFMMIGAGAPLTFAMGAASLGLGIWGGVCLWKKGTLLLEEPKTRENLNQIMIDALKAYDERKYKEFIDVISKEYSTGISLLKLKRRGDVIDLEGIIDKLLVHGFRSDGIAYLLNLLGEVLSSGKIKIEGMTTKELKELAKDVFYGVSNEKLKAEAVKLDNRIHELRKSSYKSYVKIAFNKFKDSVLLNEYSDMAQEYKDDAREMPFQSRLEEMCNIARINLVIFDILDAGSEEIARAIKTIRDIRYSINCNFQFVSRVKSRLEVLEDFLWVINVEESPDESQKLSLVTFPMESIQDADKYFQYLNNKLPNASSKQEKIHLYNDIAAYYVQLAEKDDKLNHLKSLRHWKTAQENYERARELDHKNSDSALGFAKCLLKLSKYTQVTELSITSPVLNSLSEYWLFCSIANYKQTNYERANDCIIESLRIDSQNKLAGEQRELLKKLTKENTINYRINRYEREKEVIEYEMDYLKSHNNNSPVYNILSIDGGGIRGVLPALWLSEIEHRTHRPISHLFNMIAGTSTGGIIAAGLSAPLWQLSSSNSDYYNYSDLKPKLSASNLLNIYQNQAKDLFATVSGRKYKKEELFYKHFSEVRLDKVLTELVIPASNLTHPYLFTRYDACIDKSKNDTLVDTLMATTAAPQFFSPYKIKGKGDFLDGGMHLNNPAMTAYNEAIRYQVASEKISVLSLGTGSYIPDPLNPDVYRNQLFWAQNHKIVIPAAQEVNTDCQMYDMLGNRYQRWQVWFEEPIGFNCYKSIPNLLEIGNQYIEELDSSDENPVNKLVESFEKGPYG